jgi:phosphoglycolate phosphatase
MNFKHIIWDWNGTLLDDMPLALRVVNHMLARRNMRPLSAEGYLETFDHPVQEFYKCIGFDFFRETFEDVAWEFGEGYAREWGDCSLHVGARELLQQCSSAGLTQSILSASQRDVLARNVRHFGLTDLISDLSALEDNMAHSKVEQGVKWLNGSGLSPGDLVLVGDTTHDYETAQALGCKSILVAAGHQSRERLESCNTLVLDSLAQLAVMLKDS